ncbi:hypothetical protein [Micromonospora schwarzwaldensis]
MPPGGRSGGPDPGRRSGRLAVLTTRADRDATPDDALVAGAAAATLAAMR